MNKTMSAQDLEKMYHKYKNFLYKIAFTYVKNQQDAEDILQEVFTARLYKAPAFDSEEHEKRWLIRVTVNSAKNYLKSFWHRNTTSLETSNIDIPWETDAVKRELFRKYCHCLTSVKHLCICTTMQGIRVKKLGRC